MTEPRTTGTVERRAPIVGELDELNHATTARWLACEHRPSLTVLTRPLRGDGWGVFVVCAGCSVPYLVSKTAAFSGKFVPVSAEDET